MFLSCCDDKNNPTIFHCSLIILILNCLVDSSPSLVSLSVDIREIKEIRMSQKSRDFDRYVEDSTARPDQAHCFIILYGTEFRLKALSLAGKPYLCCCASLLYTDTRTRTHTHSHSHTRIRTHTRTRTHTHSHSHTRIRTHTRTRTLTHSRSHSHSHTLTHTHTHSHTYTLSHTLSHTRTHTHTLTHTLSHTHSRTHTLAHTLSHTHTHTLSHTHSHTRVFMLVLFCLCAAATSDEETVMWVKGLNWLMNDTLRSPTPLQIER